ncbi:MAG: hypothetical protein R3E36_02540 [Nitrosomonas sp.]|nr:hypothetical protein [Nitrosomonas sp.]
MGKRLTSRYVLVVHEVTTTSVKIWVGALLPSLAKPHNWRLVVRKVNSETDRKNETGEIIKTITHLKEQGDVWERPFDRLDKRFFKVEIIDGLESGQDYIIEFESRVELEWELLEKSFLTTLPQALPAADDRPFTIGLGSCFYTKHDGGRAGQAFEALYRHHQYRPDIKFLTGDQVYLDIGLGWYPLSEDDCQDRIADDYAESWDLMRSILRRGGTWMLADDHEYWNNYPFLKGINPYLATLQHDEAFKQRWEAAAKRGVQIVQQIQTLRIFNIGNDISFCIADLRSERTKHGFMSDAAFQQLLNWTKQLACPGVLVIPQPLIAGKGDVNDKNLPDWPQYNELIVALQNGGHDIVVLAGDVHFGRVSQVTIGGSGNKLIEVIASPISNLSELNGYAASKPDTSSKMFPVAPVAGVPANPVDYLGTVTTENKWWDLRFPRPRTTEHLMTVSFYRDGQSVKMKVYAWDVWNPDRRSGLPKPIRKFDIAPIALK